MSFENTRSRWSPVPGRGIGEACAKELVGLGARVVVTDIKREGAQRVVNEIAAAGGKAAACAANSASPEDNKKAVAFAVDTFGKLNYAVNNAGIGGAAVPAGETDLEDWKRVIDINLNARDGAAIAQEDIITDKALYDTEIVLVEAA